MESANIPSHPELPDDDDDDVLPVVLDVAEEA
jgi:hypothetical protein